MNGQLRRINSGSAGIVDAARCPACGHPARIHNAVGCVSGPCECVVTRAELMPDAPRLDLPDGIESTPAVKAAAPSDRDGGHAAQGRPVKADAPAAAPVVPVRPSSAWDPPKLLPLPPLPGAGIPRTPPMVEVATPDEDVARQEEVAAVPPPAATADFEPLLARALYVSARWYCPKCHQWPLNPGACPDCRKPLQAVYTVTIPREHP